MKRIGRITIPVAGALAGAVAALSLPRPVGATCLLNRDQSAMFEPGDTGPRETLPVYLNAAQNEGDPYCARDIRRTGISAADAERLVLADITAINEAAAPVSRLVYGGRVCHDTRLGSCFPDQNALIQQEWLDGWEAATGVLEPGVVVEASECLADRPGDDPGGVASANSCDRTGVGKDLPGIATIRFKAFQDDEGAVCERPAFPGLTEAAEFAEVGNGKAECHAEGPENPEGQPCTMADEMAPKPCTCFDEVNAGEDYTGYYICDPGDDPDEDVDNMWTSCKCRNRGYETFNVGDGGAHPAEPVGRCDTLGPINTKDFRGVLLHELGHVLGLDHAEKPPSDCDGPLSNDAGSTFGVMSSFRTPQHVGKGGRYYPDDVRGLRWLYSEPAPGFGGPYVGGDGLPTQWRIDVFESTDGLAWSEPEPLEASVETTAVPPAVSRAHDDSGTFVVGLVSADQGVFVLTGDDGGLDPLTFGEALVPQAAAQFTPSVAYGGGKVAVAWVEQGNDAWVGQLRWNIRPLDDVSAWLDSPGSWQPAFNDDIVLFRPETSLTYDAASERFVLAATAGTEGYSDDDAFPSDNDGQPLIVFIDEDGVEQGFATFPDVPQVSTLGALDCQPSPSSQFADATQCVLFASLAEQGGPSLAALTFGLGPDVSDVQLERLEATSVGSISAAAGVPDSAGVQPYLVSYVGADTRQVSLDLGSVTTEGPDGPGSGPPTVSELSPATITAAPGEDGEPPVPQWSVTLAARGESPRAA